ncbi:MAG: hypothetical protein JXQ23_05025 [Clostridia bacterium]|nr:hypothetical protein [Clostridia bacterium]
MKTNKKFRYALIIGIVSILITIELPYSDRSLVQYLIPNIKYSILDGKLFMFMLSNLLPLAGFILSYILILKSKKYKGSGFQIFILMFIILQILSSNIHYIKTPVYMFGNGVKAIEIIDTELNGMQIEDDQYLKLDLEMRIYHDLENEYTITLKLPDEYATYLESTDIVLDNHIGMVKFHKADLSANIKINENYTMADINDIFYENYFIILKDSQNEIVNKRNDFY